MIRRDAALSYASSPNFHIKSSISLKKASTVRCIARAKSRAAAPELKDNIDVTAGEKGTWTFTMPEANVWVKDAGILAAGKCWVQLEKSPANARALSIVFEGETTGISEELRVKSEKFATAPVYDLQGRRVMQPTKGLFIVGGKKVVIK